MCLGTLFPCGGQWNTGTEWAENITTITQGQGKRRNLETAGAPRPRIRHGRAQERPRDNP
jgi:hypothetical protein